MNDGEDVDLLPDQRIPSGCSPGGTYYRFVGLFFMCLLGFGSYFCFDNPGALQDSINKDMHLSTEEFSYLYSFYNWPNVILCFVGGFLIDRVFGIRFGTSLYAFIVFTGQLIFAFGSIVDSLRIMLLGRLIFGIGGESLAVAQNYYAVQWFEGKELNMIFGLQMSVARVGSAVNFVVMDPVLKYVQQFYKGREALGVTLLLASVTCLVSFISAVILAIMDAKIQNRENTKHQISQPNNEASEEEIARLTDAKDFPLPFWFITIICVVYYVAIFPFIGLGKVFFMRKFNFSPSEANHVISYIYFMSAVASPTLGLLVDKTGWNIFWVFISIISTVGAHALLTFTWYNPYIAMTILGLSYSMCASALWPMISLVIRRYQLGSAYGMAQALQNLGLAIATMIAGMIVDAGGYWMLEMFFLCWLFGNIINQFKINIFLVALITCLILWIDDIRNLGILNMTAQQREEHASASSTIEIIRQNSMADVSPHDITQPQSSIQIRNRFLSKVGDTNMPAHVFRALR